MVPPVCLVHYQMGEKFLIRAVRRAGCAIPTHRRPNPKFHLVLSEFVRHVQEKRKAALRATVPKAEIE